MRLTQATLLQSFILGILLIIIPITAFFSHQRVQLQQYAAEKTKNSWFESFSGNTLDATFWNVSNYPYDQGKIANQHQGYFQPDKVSVGDGYLTLALTQENGTVGTNQNGVISRAGEIATKNSYGYGTYEWHMRTSSTASSPTDITGQGTSGQISAGFLYNTNSQTELDFEIEGQSQNQLELSSWNNQTPANPPTMDNQTYTTASISGMLNEFKTYKLVWTPGEIKYYVDSVLVADHLTNVPASPAQVMINHWGTDSTDFGGTASIGISRYMLVDWVRYTAPGDTSIKPTTTFSTTICPHGIGICGDNANPTSNGNTTPAHSQRDVTLTIFDTNNMQVATQSGTVTYIPATQNFQGDIPIDNLENGTYLVTVKLNGFLAKRLPGIFTVSNGQTVILPSATVISSDINNDNQIDLLDYNIFISCFGDKYTTTGCIGPETSRYAGADLNDDGMVNGSDYNLFLRELSVQNGG